VGFKSREIDFRSWFYCSNVFYHVDNAQSLTSLRRLETLILSYNKIEVIEHVHEILSLQTLQLDNNLIDTIPDNLASLQLLEELLLEQNKLKTVPACLRREIMPALNYLVLEYNPIEHIPDEILQDQVRRSETTFFVGDSHIVRF
jgi:Leucine-rich repeat (LRR) protein